MILTKENIAVLERFNFDLPPVGVKFLAKQPDKIERLDEKMALCEMLKQAQEGAAFFAGAASHTCEAGLYVLGQADISEPFASGDFGAGCVHLRHLAPEQKKPPTDGRHENENGKNADDNDFL